MRSPQRAKSAIESTVQASRLHDRDVEASHMSTHRAKRTGGVAFESTKSPSTAERQGSIDSTRRSSQHGDGLLSPSRKSKRRAKSSAGGVATQSSLSSSEKQDLAQPPWRAKSTGGVAIQSTKSLHSAVEQDTLQSSSCHDKADKDDEAKDIPARRVKSFAGEAHKSTTSSSCRAKSVAGGASRSTGGPERHDLVSKYHSPPAGQHNASERTEKRRPLSQAKSRDSSSPSRRKISVSSHENVKVTLTSQDGESGEIASRRASRRTRGEVGDANHSTKYSASHQSFQRKSSEDSDNYQSVRTHPSKSSQHVSTSRRHQDEHDSGEISSRSRTTSMSSCHDDTGDRDNTSSRRRSSHARRQVEDKGESEHSTSPQPAGHVWSRDTSSPSRRSSDYSKSDAEESEPSTLPRPVRHVSRRPSKDSSRRSSGHSGDS